MNTSSLSVSKKDHMIRYIVIGILFFLILERLLLVLSTENEMTLFSDDNGYLNSAITYMKTHYITYGNYSQKTAFIMPGMPWLLSSLFTFFGYDNDGLIVSRFFFSLLSVASAYFAYKIACRHFDSFTGIITLLFVGLNIPLTALSVIFLTESPYTFLLLGTMYFYMVWLDNTKKISSYAWFLIFYVAQLFLKGLGILTPFCLIIQTIIAVKKHRSTWKTIIRGITCAVVIALICLLPWVIRNYNAFGRFTLFTANLGDGKLLGTFQGYGYPVGTYNESLATVNSMLAQITNSNSTTRFDLEAQLASERLSEWFQTHPFEFLYTHIIWKPWHSIQNQYYPLTIFNFPTSIVNNIWNIFLIFSAVGTLLSVFNAIKKKSYQGLALLVSILILLLYTSLYYSHSRYSMPYAPIILILSAYGFTQMIGLFVQLFQKGMQLKAGRWLKTGTN